MPKVFMKVNLFSEFTSNNNSDIIIHIMYQKSYQDLISTLYHNSSPINCDTDLFNNYFYSIFTTTSNDPTTKLVLDILLYLPALPSPKKKSIAVLTSKSWYNCRI